MRGPNRTASTRLDADHGPSTGGTASGSPNAGRGPRRAGGTTSWRPVAGRGPSTGGVVSCSLDADSNLDESSHGRGKVIPVLECSCALWISIETDL
jgi:hypothetical protein